MLEATSGNEHGKLLVAVGMSVAHAATEHDGRCLEEWLSIDILQHPGSVGLSEEQKRQLDSEYKEYFKDPKEGRPWKSIKDDILGQL